MQYRSSGYAFLPRPPPKEHAADFRLAGCQDIDDALHARRLPNGNIEAGVRESIVVLSDIAKLTLRSQTSPTSPTLFTPTTRWTPKLRRAERPSTSSTNVSTCCLIFSARTSAVCDLSLSDWPSLSSGFVPSPFFRVHLVETSRRVGDHRGGRYRQRSLHQVGHRLEGGLHV